MCLAWLWCREYCGPARTANGGGGGRGGGGGGSSNINMIVKEEFVTNAKNAMRSSLVFKKPTNADFCLEAVYWVCKLYRMEKLDYTVVAVSQNKKPICNDNLKQHDLSSMVSPILRVYDMAMYNSEWWRPWTRVKINIKFSTKIYKILRKKLQIFTRQITYRKIKITTQYNPYILTNTF